MDPPRILVTGGTGFVGTAVLDLLRAGRSGRASGRYAGVRVLVHERSGPTRGVERVAGDLTDAGSLRGLCRGVDTVLHLANYVGTDPVRCHQVNDLGTRYLLREAQAAGVRRLVYLSTTGVYGDAVATNAGEHTLTPDPVSTTSSSRRAAERAVLAAGGIVLRPHLVFGTGDRWVIPTLVEIVRRVGGVPAGGRARQSVIAVQELARILAALAGPATVALPSGPYHAGHPVPSTVREMVGVVATMLDPGLPSDPVPTDLAIRRMPEAARQVRLLATDRWYDSAALWRGTALRPGPAFAQAFPAAVQWYRRYPGIAAEPASP